MKHLERFNDRFLPSAGITNYLELAMPVPISANAMNKVGRGKLYRSPEYTRWINECILDLGNCPGEVPEPCSIELIMHGGIGFAKNRDCDNLLKPVIDTLRRLKVIKSDTVTAVPYVSCRYLEPDSSKSFAWLEVIVRHLDHV